MSFLKQFFGASKSERDTATLHCQFESSNKDCNLIQLLKEKQTVKRAVDQKIRAYERKSTECLPSFIKLLTGMEELGFSMKRERKAFANDGSYRSYVAESFDHFPGMIPFTRLIEQTAEQDISKIREELIAFKCRADTLEELRRQSASLDKEIMAIKAQLGIE